MMNHQGTKEIDTGRLILRPFQYEDAEDMLQYWVSDPDVQYWYCEPVYTTMEQVRELLDKYISSYENDAYYRWAVIEKESDICIGQIALFLVNTRHQFSEIEYCIGRKFQRSGYASEATRAVLDFSFGQVHFHKVQICHREGNRASQGVIQKCGFTYEGTLRDYFYENDRYYDRLYYSMLFGEWRERREKPEQLQV